MSNTTENSAVTAQIAQDSETRELDAAGLRGTRDLSDGERRRFEMPVDLWMIVLQETRVFEVDGLEDADRAERRRAQLARITQQPGLRGGWACCWGTMSPPGFHEEVEASMETSSLQADGPRAPSLAPPLRCSTLHFWVRPSVKGLTQALRPAQAHRRLADAVPRASERRIRNTGRKLASVR